MYGKKWGILNEKYGKSGLIFYGNIKQTVKDYDCLHTAQRAVSIRLIAGIANHYCNFRF
jgi:hypothetical protein